MGGEWMIGKFATAIALTLLVLTILLGAQGFAQTTPAEQTPAATPPTPAPAAQQAAAQQPASGQEPADEESTSRRKAKPHDYKNWTFNVGAGWRRGGYGGRGAKCEQVFGAARGFLLCQLATARLYPATGAGHWSHK